MSNDLFTHHIGCTHNRESLLEEIDKLYDRMRDALPVTVQLVLRVHSKNWRVTSDVWAGGNDSTWFGARVDVVQHPTVLNVAFLDVEVYLDNGH